MDLAHPLVTAAAFGDNKTLAKLSVTREELNAQFSLNEDHGAAYENVTALMVAAGSPWANAKTVRLLLDKGAEIRVRSDMGCTAVWYAASGIPGEFLDKGLPREGDWWHERGGDVERLRLLVDAGGSVDDSSSHGRTVLVEAAAQGNAESVRYLLERGANPQPWHRRPSSWSLPLHAAAASGSVECVQLLLDAGVRADTEDSGRVTAIAHAKTPEIVKLLIANGAKPTGKGGFMSDVLDKLFEAEEYEAARAVLEAGGDVETSRWGVNRAHAHAGIHMDPIALRILAENGADLRKPGYNGGTILHTACWQGDYSEDRGIREVIGFLVDQGIPIDAIDRHGATALHEAIGGDWAAPNAVDALLENGANPNISLPDGTTPLMMAARKGEVECVELLLKGGADPTLRDKRGVTALDLARRNLEGYTSGTGGVSFGGLARSVLRGLGASKFVDWLAESDRESAVKAQRCVDLLGEAVEPEGD